MSFDEKQTIRRNDRSFSNRVSQSVHFDVHCSTPISDYLIDLIRQSDCRFRSIEFAGFCCYDRLRRALTGGGLAAQGFFVRRAIRHSAFAGAFQSAAARIG
ncbi:MULTISPECIES: hypothetical protein [Burkholderia]|uniref:hypothetical protein n=1 Tax=Burkholderia TaxID=32008 RepID=UPI0015C5C863|nr:MULTISPECIES: hypothetical protein [Burkholderia]